MNERKGYEPELFNIILRKQGLELFDATCDFIDKLLKDKLKSMAENEYETLTKIMNNENNAGWDTEKVHSVKMDIIRNKQNVLVERYLENELEQLEKKGV